MVLLPCVVVDVCSSLTHATHSFNKLSRPLTLISPAHGAQVQNDVTLTWDDYLDSQKVVDGADPDLSTPLDTPGQDEAEYYNVQTASDQNFTQNVTTTKVDQTTFTSFADTYPEGTTWWRVQAVDRNGNTLAWSAPRSLPQEVAGAAARCCPPTATPSPATTRCPGPRRRTPRRTTSRSTRAATPPGTPSTG